MWLVSTPEVDLPLILHMRRGNSQVENLNYTSYGLPLPMSKSNIADSRRLENCYDIIRSG